MKVLHAASELYPLVSTGGLSSVVSALPAALERYENIETAVVIPFYGEIAPKIERIHWHEPLHTFLDEEFGIGSAKVDGLKVFLVTKKEYFAREGIYGSDSGHSWPDNPERFSFFSRAVAALAFSELFQPDLIHCHDWQTALVPVYLRQGGIPVVLTIHNLQFQGRFQRGSWAAAALPETLYTIHGLEFWGDWNCLKGGIVFADRVTTVSPGYAKEILTPQFGCSLDGVLREHSSKLAGILNGIDTDVWNPSTDSSLPGNFGPGEMSGKKICKRALERETGLDPYPEGLLLGMVSRLTEQKGIDLVIDAAEHIVNSGHRLVVLGTGESWAEEALKQTALKYPGRISAVIAYDDRLARLIFAGSDGYLMPSRFEPCGLGQMMAMRYGSVPLASSVGGLADTVDEKRGFPFSGGPGGFISSLNTMGDAFRNSRKWSWYRRRCMKADFSWKDSVSKYADEYRKALELR